MPAFQEGQKMPEHQEYGAKFLHIYVLFPCAPQPPQIRPAPPLPEGEEALPDLSLPVSPGVQL